MTKLAGRLVMAISVIHFLFGFWFGRRTFGAIARDGFWNAVDPDPRRQFVFWFVAFSIPFLILGGLLAGMGSRGAAPPRWLGWSLLVFTLVLCFLMPVSGGWLLLVPAVLLISAAQREARVWRRDEFIISTGRAKLDRKMVHEFLASSYWAKAIPREVVDRSIDGALSFGLYDGERQIGFARAITDYATFAYLSDVFVLESHRGRGLATWLMETILAHPQLQGLRRWMLSTRDAHELYRKTGFTALAHPERFMEVAFPDIYADAGKGGSFTAAPRPSG